MDTNGHKTMEKQSRNLYRRMRIQKQRELQERIGDTRMSHPEIEHGVMSQI